MIRSLVCALVFAGFPAAAGAAMYKCVQPNGTTAFQDSPCKDAAHDPAPGTKSTAPALEVKPAAPALIPPGASQPATAPSLSVPGANTPAVDEASAKPDELTKWQKAGRLALVLLGIAGVVLILKIVTTILEPGRSGVFIWFMAVCVTIVFQGAFGLIPHAVAYWAFLTVFASAFVYTWLFKTHYFKSLLLSMTAYGLFISLPLMLYTNMLQAQPFAPYSPPDKDFTISMPGVPTEQTVVTPDHNSTIQVHSRNVVQWSYQVARYDFVKPIENPTAGIERARDSLARSENSFVVSQTLSKLGDKEYREVLYQRPDGSTLKSRFFVVGTSRVYLVSIAIPSGMEASPKINEYLNSFSIN